MTKLNEDSETKDKSGVKPVICERLGKVIQALPDFAELVSKDELSLTAALKLSASEKVLLNFAWKKESEIGNIPPVIRMDEQLTKRRMKDELNRIKETQKVNLTGEVFKDCPTSDLELDEVQVDVSVSCTSTAMFVCDFTFTNTSQKVLEGEFVFPVRQNDVIVGFGFDIDGQIVDAVPVPKKKAQLVFDKVVNETKGHAVAIVEKIELSNMYRTMIYPVNPKEKRMVRIKIMQKIENNVIKFPIKLSKKKLTLALRSCSQNIDKIIVHTKSGKEEWKKEDFVKIEGKEVLCVDLVLPKEKKNKVSIEKGDRGYFFSAEVPMGFQKSGKTEKKNWREFTVFWDISASREEFFEKEKAVFWKMVNALRSTNDSVNLEIVTFGLKMFDSKKFSLKEKGFKNQIKTFLEGVVHDGGTIFVDFMKFKSDCFVIFTDGIGNCNNFDYEGFVPGAPIFPISFSESYNPNILDFLAQKSGGLFFNNPDEKLDILKEILGVQYIGIKGIEYDRSNVADVVFRCSNDHKFLTLFGKIIGDQKTKVSVIFSDGKRREVLISYTKDVKGIDGIGVIQYMWAQEKIKLLEIGEDSHLKEIKRISEDFGIVTKDCSLLVLGKYEDYEKFLQSASKNSERDIKIQSSKKRKVKKKGRKPKLLVSLSFGRKELNGIRERTFPTKENRLMRLKEIGERLEHMRDDSVRLEHSRV